MQKSSFVCAVICFFMFTSCAHLSSTREEIDLLKEENQKLKKDIEASHEKLTKNIKEIIREELLPEIQGLSFVPKDIRNKQMEAKTKAAEKVVVGRVEWIKIKNNGMRLKARIDTGAQTSSIHAENVVEKIIEGKRYVQFESYDFKDKKHVFLKEVVKKQKVRSSSGTLSDRFVVKMTIALGTEEHNINVNLNDREDLQYNFLVGRNLLMGKYVVDVSQTRLLGN